MFNALLLFGNMDGFCLSLLLLHFAHATYGVGHFIKEHSTDAHQFPPPYSDSLKGIPAGHLRPLGYQRPTEGKVKAIHKDAITRQLFHDKAFEERIPIIVRSNYFPLAVKLWGDKYLAKTYGNETVVFEEKTGMHYNNTKLDLRSFLKRYHYDNIWVNCLLPESMKKDLDVPIFMQCPTEMEYLDYADLWISSGPTPRPLQFVADDALHCLLEGRTDYILIESEYRSSFTPLIARDHNYSGCGYSELDIDSINMFSYANISQIPWQWATIRPGDCIFIPADYMFQSRTYGRSVSVNLYIIPLHTYEPCMELNSTKRKLSDISFFYKNEHTTKVVNVSEWTGTLVKTALQMLIKRKGELHAQQFVHFYTNIVGHRRATAEAAWHVIKELDKSFSGTITQRQFEQLQERQLNRIAGILNNSDDKVVRNREEL